MDGRDDGPAAVIVVDAMNVIGSRPDGWWRDRDGALRRLVGDVARWAATRDGEVLVVADGRPPSDLPEGPVGAVGLRYARRSGRDAADDRIVEVVADLGDRGVPALVVTADRELRARVTALGARVRGPRWLRDAIGAVSG